MDKTQNLIRELELKPHPEGGFFRETYRSSGKIDQKCLPSHYSGQRSHSTCIYFLLTSDSFSAFHRIKQDEIWHFYDGSPIELHMISEKGDYQKVIIGRDINIGERPQFVVPGGYWFAARVIQKNDYSLVGCTVEPGFEFEDFELGERKKLLNKFPSHKRTIIAFTRA